MRMGRSLELRNSPTKESYDTLSDSLTPFPTKLLKKDFIEILIGKHFNSCFSPGI